MVHTKVDDTRLGGVVRSLHLREIDNVTTHGGSSHETTVCEVGELVAIQVSALLLLPAPVASSSLGAIECAVQIDADNIAVVFDRAVHHRTLGPGNTGVGNENVQTAVEVLDNSVDSLLHGLGVSNLNLIGLGCSKQSGQLPILTEVPNDVSRTLDSVLLSHLSRTLRTLGVASIPHGHVGSSLGQTVSDGETDTGTGTSNNGSFSLQRKHAHQTGMLGSNSVVVDKQSILNRIGSHCDGGRCVEGYHGVDKKQKGNSAGPIDGISR